MTESDNNCNIDPKERECKREIRLNYCRVEWGPAADSCDYGNDRQRSRKSCACT